MIERRPIVSLDEWLEWRKRDVTASEVAAVFGLHPWLTMLELWATKSGVDMGKDDTAAMRRGRIMEPSVAAAVELERPEWKLRKCTHYASDPRARLGASPDFWIDGDPRGVGLLQAKTVAESAKRDFEDDSPPFWITLQNTQELMLHPDVAFGVVAVLFVGYGLAVRLFETPRHSPAEKKIREGVAEFWKAVEAGTQPTADYGRDAGILAALYPHEIEGTSVDLAGDNLLPGLLEERERLVAERGAADKRLDEIADELKAKLGDAEFGYCPPWRITWRAQTREASLQPEATFRVLRVTKEKTK